MQANDVFFVLFIGIFVYTTVGMGSVQSQGYISHWVIFLGSSVDCSFATFRRVSRILVARTPTINC